MELGEPLRLRIRGSACRVNRAAVSSIRLERGLGTLGGFKFVAK